MSTLPESQRKLNEGLKAFLYEPEEYFYNNCHSVNGVKFMHDLILINDKPAITKEGGKVFIQDFNADMLHVLNSFEGIKAVKKEYTYVINGIEWDGSKTNINLFI